MISDSRFSETASVSSVPGLFFVGVHFQRTRKSALLFGVGEDASIVSHHVRALLASGRSRG